jgi:hypothetical protein
MVKEKVQSDMSVCPLNMTECEEMLAFFKGDKIHSEDRVISQVPRFPLNLGSATVTSSSLKKSIDT